VGLAVGQVDVAPLGDAEMPKGINVGIDESIRKIGEMNTGKTGEKELALVDFQTFWDGYGNTNLDSTLATIYSVQGFAMTLFLMWLLYFIVGRGVTTEAANRRSERIGGLLDELTRFDDMFSNRRADLEDVASQLVLLAEAFKKYEVNEDGCQLYVACNSSKLAGKGNTLEKITHGVLSLVAEPGNEYLYKNDKYLQDMVTAFKTGPRGTCDTFRKLCRRKFH